MKLHAPSIPLFNVDPYFSVWSNQDNLYARCPVHWIGTPNNMWGTVSVDGTEYRFLGKSLCPSPRVFDNYITQTGIDIDACSTTVYYENEIIKLKAVFTSPMLAEDLYYASRPVTYLKLSYESADGKPHTVKAKFAVSEDLVLDKAGDSRVWSEAITLQQGDCIRMGSGKQNVLWRSGDGVRIDWGYLYLAAKGKAKVGNCILGDLSCVYAETEMLECNYLFPTQAFCPQFDSFLFQITNGDFELQNRIMEMIGYIVSPDTSGKVLFLLQGCSNSGKTILASLIASVFNEEAVEGIDIHSLNERFAVSELEGKALCISSDLPCERLDSKSTSKLKQLTGNDMISADVKYSDRVKFYCKAKFVLVTNHALFTSQNDDAFLERVVVVPFAYSVPESQRDRMLLERLKAEKDAIVSKAIDAYFRLKQNGYRFSGDYEINSVIENCEDENLIFYILIYVQNEFEYCEDGGEFLCDIHQAFCGKYGYISINVFSEHLLGHAKRLFGARKIRRRRAPNENPRSFIAGMKYKER